MKIDVVVLAGGEASQVVDTLSGPKSLIDIGGRPMISYVMDALRQCPDLGRIVIALPTGADAVPFLGFSDLIAVDTTGVVDAIAKAIKVVGEEGSLLIVSSDAPMISSRAITDFLDLCRAAPADIHYTIIPKEATDAAFPGTRRTYVRLRDGTFTGGNVHLTRKDTFIRNQETGERLFAKRKSPLGLLRLLGITFVFKFLTGRLTIDLLEKKVGQLLTAKTKAVVTSYPELGVDVDKPEDLRIAREYMAKLANK